MRRVLLIVMLLASPALAQDRSRGDEVVFASTKDPEMVAAIKKARDTLDEFLALAARPPANTSGFKLKVMIRDGADTEHFWVTPFEVDGASFQGILANQPRVVRTVRAGQIVRFSRAEISDWGYVKDGRQVGSFTVCALFKNMSREQAEYYRKNHGFDC